MVIENAPWPNERASLVFRREAHSAWSKLGFSSSQDSLFNFSLNIVLFSLRALIWLIGGFVSLVQLVKQQIFGVFVVLNPSDDFWKGII